MRGRKGKKGKKDEREELGREGGGAKMTGRNVRDRAKLRGRKGKEGKGQR